MKKRRGALCKSCGEPFMSYLSDKGRWTHTCSLECRLAAFDRMIAGLVSAREKLAAQVAAAGAHASGRHGSSVCTGDPTP